MTSHAAAISHAATTSHAAAISHAAMTSHAAERGPCARICRAPVLPAPLDSARAP